MTRLLGRALPALLTSSAILIGATPAQARTDLTRVDELRRCPGRIHAGFTREERRPEMGYGRYRGISCRRARAIVTLVDAASGGFPIGYSWETPHGPSSTWPAVFGHVLSAAYLAFDGLHGTRRSPGVAVAVFRD